MQSSIANDKPITSPQPTPYKIKKTPVIKLLEASSYLPEYSMLHLDYFADECKQHLINKSPFLATLMLNCLVASFFQIEEPTAMFYSYLKLLSVGLFFSGCNTLIKPKKLIQLISLFFYGFSEYIFPIYSIAISSRSYINKLGINGCIPTFLLSLATLGAFLVTKDNERPFLKNIYLLATENSLPITPKMQLIKTVIQYKKNKEDCLFLYSGSTEADENDNLLSKFYKWVTLHADDISLVVLNYIAHNQSVLSISEERKANELQENLTKSLHNIQAKENFYPSLLEIKNNISKIKEFRSSMAITYFIRITDFYKTPIFLEYVQEINNLLAKTGEYTALILNDKQAIITHQDLHMNFIKQVFSQQIDSKDLIDILNNHKALTVEILYKNYSLYETIVKDSSQSFSVLKHNSIYYVFFALDFQSTNNSIISNLIDKLYKRLCWFLLSGEMKFTTNSCLIIKLEDINVLNAVLKYALELLSCMPGTMNVYTFFSEKKLNKLKQIATN